MTNSSQQQKIYILGKIFYAGIYIILRTESTSFFNRFI